MGETPTKSAVRRAGSAVRKYSRQEIGAAEFESHLTVLVSYRAGFAGPLERFHDRLIDVQNDAEIEAETTRRLKRIPTILNKLIREPKLDLSRMQDIGGCRSVVRDLDELYTLRNLVVETWPCAEKDYVKAPRSSGYRSIHLVASVEGTVVELQLRTKIMQDWAQTVEAFSAVIGDNFKQDGDHVVQDYMRVLSEVMHSREMGLEVDPDLAARLDQLRPPVAKLIDDASGRTEKDDHEFN